MKVGQSVGLEDRIQTEINIITIIVINCFILSKKDTIAFHISVHLVSL